VPRAVAVGANARPPKRTPLDRRIVALGGVAVLTAAGLVATVAALVAVSLNEERAPNLDWTSSPPAAPPQEPAYRALLAGHDGVQGTFVRRGEVPVGAVAEQSGASVALSADGGTLAVGSPFFVDPKGRTTGRVRVHDWVGDAWVPRGYDIYGAGVHVRAGASVKLSASGTVLAVGSPLGGGPGGANAGTVNVYDWAGGAWVERGIGLHGNVTYGRSGASISLSADGLTVAVGAPNGAGQDAGYARVLQWSPASSAWVQLGADVQGAQLYDLTGAAVALSGDGRVLAVGSPKWSPVASTDINYRGRVRVHVWDGVGWAPRGAAVEGACIRCVHEYSGASVALNDDGTVLAVGAPFNDMAGSSSGTARVFVWDGTAWRQAGQDLRGRQSFELGGATVALSASGAVVALGGPGWSLEGPYRLTDGKVKPPFSNSVSVYAWNATQWERTGDSIRGAAGDYTGAGLAMSRDGRRVAVGAPGWGAKEAGEVAVFWLEEAGAAE